MSRDQRYFVIRFDRWFGAMDTPSAINKMMTGPAWAITGRSFDEKSFVVVGEYGTEILADKDEWDEAVVEAFECETPLEAARAIGRVGGGKSDEYE